MPLDAADVMIASARRALGATLARLRLSMSFHEVGVLVS
jgi:hypothetical protein